MGEMADFALSEVMDMEDLRFSYRMGDIGYQDAYDLGIIDERGFENYRPMFHTPTVTTKQCKHCGETGLHWMKAPTGWRLGDSAGKVHSCDKHVFIKERK